MPTKKVCTTIEFEEIKKVDQVGINFLANEEGIKLKPYLDSVGVPTIGIGCTYYDDGKKVTMKDKAITQKRAFELFANVLKGFEMEVYSRTRDDINQHQFNALTSLCFNIGREKFKTSTVLRRVNANKKDPTIKEAFEMWRNAKGKPILLARRQREAKLYFS